MTKTGRKCLSCPQILTEEYGSGSNKCAECLANEKSYLIIAVSPLGNLILDSEPQFWEKYGLLGEVFADTQGIKVPKLKKGIYLMNNIKTKKTTVMYGLDSDAGWYNFEGDFKLLYSWEK